MLPALYLFIRVFFLTPRLTSCGLRNTRDLCYTFCKILLTSRFRHRVFFACFLSDPDFLRHLSARLHVLNAHTQQNFQTWLTSPWSTSLIKWYAGDWDVSVFYSLTSRHGQSHYCWQTGPRLKSQEPLSWTEAYYWPITTSTTATTTTCFKTRINAAYWNVVNECTDVLCW